MALNEADTCRRYIVPRLQAAGWDDEPHRINEQVTFTDGRIIVSGRQGRRRPAKHADYILRYRPDMPIAVVEAKPSYATPGQGLQQAKEYAEILGLKFAYATNVRRRRLKPADFLKFRMPLPSRKVQYQLREIVQRTKVMHENVATMITQLDAMLPSILDKAFKGEL